MTYKTPKDLAENIGNKLAQGEPLQITVDKAVEYLNEDKIKSMPDEVFADQLANDEWNEVFAAKTRLKNMIERVARVIDFQAWRTLETTFDSQHQLRLRLNSIDKAKAAIAAMREPTEKMLKSCENIMGGGFQNSHSDLETWQTMIDAALKE